MKKISVNGEPSRNPVIVMNIFDVSQIESIEQPTYKLKHMFHLCTLKAQSKVHEQETHVPLLYAWDICFTLVPLKKASTGKRDTRFNFISWSTI